MATLVSKDDWIKVTDVHRWPGWRYLVRCELVTSTLIGVAEIKIKAPEAHAFTYETVQRMPIPEICAAAGAQWRMAHPDQRIEGILAQDEFAVYNACAFFEGEARELYVRREQRYEQGIDGTWTIEPTAAHNHPVLSDGRPHRVSG